VMMTSERSGEHTPTQRFGGIFVTRYGNGVLVDQEIHHVVNSVLSNHVDEISISQSQVWE
jgi:hypothetical protein